MFPWVRMVPFAMILFASMGKVQMIRALSVPKGIRLGINASCHAFAISLAIFRMSSYLSDQSQITANCHLEWRFGATFVP